jgi:hypothetical protein
MSKKEPKVIEYFQLFKKNIIIPFNVFFDSKFEDFSEFVLSIATKKTYSKIAPLIVSENNYILSRCTSMEIDQFIYKYMTLKIAIDTDRYRNRSQQSVISDIITTIFTSDFMKVINDYVDEMYQTNIDKGIDLDKHKYDKGTTFLDRHYKIMYKVSTMSRFIIPLMTHYIHNNPEVDGNQFIMDMFLAIINISQFNQIGKEADIYAKLHTYVSRAVRKTLYTDKTMWERLMILGVTPDIAINDTTMKLITNVMCKYSFDKNIMNLNTVVIRKSIMSYTLRKKDPYTIYSLSDTAGMASDDDSISSEIDIFDSYNTQRDESVILFRKFGTVHDIDIIQKREGITIDPLEIEFYLKSKRYHELQKSTLCFMFSRYFGGIENIIGGCRKEDWVRLMIILIKTLKKLGMEYLAEFIPAIRQNYSYKRLSKFLDTAINSDPLYQQIVEKKYKHIMGLFEKRNFIKGMIVMIINNTYTYNSYQNPLNGQNIEKDELKIVKQVLNFFNTCVF